MSYDPDPTATLNISTFNFSHTSGSASTGSLGFTPKLAIYAMTMYRTVTYNYPTFAIGVAIGTNTNASCIGHGHTSQATAWSRTGYDNDAIGGSLQTSAIGETTSAMDYDLDVTQFGSSGITLQWSGTHNNHYGALIVLG